MNELAASGLTKIQPRQVKEFNLKFENRLRGSGWVVLPMMMTLASETIVTSFGSEKKQSGSRKYRFAEVVAEVMVNEVASGIELT